MEIIWIFPFDHAELYLLSLEFYRESDINFIEIGSETRNINR